MHFNANAQTQTKDNLPQHTDIYTYMYKNIYITHNNA